MNFDVLPEPSPIDSEASRLLFAKVRALVARVPKAKRHLMGIWISPELGVRLMTRGEIAARHREAGLEAAAPAAHHLARGDRDAMLVWAECGDDIDAAEAGFYVLSLRPPRRARR